MAKFNIAEARSNLSALVQKVMLGEEVIIAKSNEPMVKLVPLTHPANHANRDPRRGRSGARRILTQLRAISGTSSEAALIDTHASLVGWLRSCINNVDTEGAALHNATDHHRLRGDFA